MAVMFDATQSFKTFSRVHALDDDEHEPRHGVHRPKPITLPKLEWRTEASFRLFAKTWRTRKRRGLDGIDASRDQPPILLSASRKAIAASARLQAEKSTVVKRKVEGSAACMEEGEPGEGLRDLVEIFGTSPAAQ
jgi:hypothetical protein